MTLVTMVKLFNGFDFWEQRYRAQQGLESEIESEPESDIDSQPSLVDSPVIAPEAITPVEIQQPWPQSFKSDGIVRSRPILIQSIGVHDVRNSMSYTPSLDHHSQSASVLHPGSWEAKEEFLTVIKRNDSTTSSKQSSRSTSPIEFTKSPIVIVPTNNTPLLRRSPLKIQTTNLSRGARAQQRHSALPKLSINNSPPEHRHTFMSSADCTPCQTDKAFDALADVLKQKQLAIIEPSTILRPSKDSPVPELRSPTPIRPKIISQHLERAQLWAESQEDFDGSTASSLSSPMSPMMPIDITDNKKTLAKPEIVPMGCNLDHDLNDFLKWESKNVCAYGYGTNGWSFSP